MALVTSEHQLACFMDALQNASPGEQLAFCNLLSSICDFGGGGDGGWGDTKTIAMGGCANDLELVYSEVTQLIQVVNSNPQAIEDDGSGPGSPPKITLHSGGTPVATKNLLNLGGSMYMVTGTVLSGVTKAQWNSIDGASVGPCYVAP